MSRLMIAALFLALAPVAGADAASARDMARCKAMQATMVPKQREIDEAKARRDDLAAIAEADGDAWENAEAVRNFSKSHAAEADAAKAAFTASRKALADSELGLQFMVQGFNEDVSAFNQSCAKPE